MAAAGLWLVYPMANIQADDAQPAAKPAVSIVTSEDENLPNAVVLSLHGQCEYSEDGTHFTELTAQHVFTTFGRVLPGASIPKEAKSQFSFHQGAIVRTGENARVDIFFRRIGTTVRLQQSTEIKLEKMSRSTKNGLPVLETLLDLRQGRIFTVARSLVEGSILEIRNAAGRAVVECGPAGSMGRYIITADGTQVADQSSVLPLKVVCEKGITVVLPGHKFDSKEGKMLALETPEKVLTLIEFDELHALAEGTNPPGETKPVLPQK